MFDCGVFDLSTLLTGVALLDLDTYEVARDFFILSTLFSWSFKALWASRVSFASSSSMSFL